MSVKTLIYPRISRPNRDAVARCGHRQRSVAADLGLSAKRTGWCHPFRVVISLLWLPGVSRGATPGYSNGIPSGCTETGMPEAVASGCGFVPQNIRGEVLMPRDCPGFSGGADPAPSGNPPCRIPARTGEDTVAGHRGILTLDLDLTLDLSGRTRTVKVSPAEWGCGFVPQHADGELLMSHDCPEIGGGGNRSPAVRTGGRSAGVSFVPNGTGAGAVRSTHRRKRWAIIGRPCGTSAPGKVPTPSSAVALSTLRSGSATEDGEDGLRRVDRTQFENPGISRIGFEIAR